MALLGSSAGSVVQLVGVLVIFLCVLAATYLTTRWIGGVQKTRMKGHCLNVVDSVQIGGNKYIQLIRAGETYLVVAVGKEEVRLLATLTREQLGADLEEMEKRSAPEKGAENFQEVLDRLREHFPKKQG